MDSDLTRVVRVQYRWWWGVVGTLERVGGVRLNGCFLGLIVDYYILFTVAVLATAVDDNESCR